MRNGGGGLREEGGDGRGKGRRKGKGGGGGVEGVSEFHSEPQCANLLYMNHISLS